MPEADNKVTPGQETDHLAVYLAAARERWNTAANGKWHDHATALELLSSALRSAADGECNHCGRVTDQDHKDRCHRAAVGSG